MKGSYAEYLWYSRGGAFLAVINDLVVVLLLHEDYAGRSYGHNGIWPSLLLPVLR
jgi:hypothetical protein